MRRGPAFWLPVLVLCLWAIVALTARLLPLTPNAIDLEYILSGPGSDTLLGHDDLGRNVTDRLLVGARTSFLVAAWVVTLALLTGTFIGTASAYLGGWWDRISVLLVDIFLAFPGILLAIALAGLLGPGIDNVVIALTVVGGWGMRGCHVPRCCH